MYDVQVFAADGTTRWVRVRQCKGESMAARQACRQAALEHGKAFYPGAVLAAS